MTFDKTAHAAQIAGCIAHTGDDVVFGSEVFTGNLAPLRADDPRLIGSSDRLFELVVQNNEVPAPAPTRGSDLIIDGIHYSVSRVDYNPAARLTLFTVAPL